MFGEGGERGEASRCGGATQGGWEEGVRGEKVGAFRAELIRERRGQRK